MEPAAWPTAHPGRAQVDAIAAAVSAARKRAADRTAAPLEEAAPEGGVGAAGAGGPAGDVSFRDADFPPCAASIGDSARLRAKVACWRRPAHFVSEATGGAAAAPCLLRDVSPADVVQGRLGDCWWLANAAVLALRADRLPAMIHPPRYSADGVYGVRFYRRGAWETVVVDDWMPCGDDGLPVFARLTATGDIWAMLLEKAAAKFCGAYQHLISGRPEVTVESLTGGVAREVYLPLPPQDGEGEGPDRARSHAGKLDAVWAELQHAHSSGKLMGACSRAYKAAGAPAGESSRSPPAPTAALGAPVALAAVEDHGGFDEDGTAPEYEDVDVDSDGDDGAGAPALLGRARPTRSAGPALWLRLKKAAEPKFKLYQVVLPNGIVSGHTYSITRVAELRHGGALQRLICIRNPWGHMQWRGAWGDDWDGWTPELLVALEHTTADDGLFWMPLEDFCREFDYFFSCRLISRRFCHLRSVASSWSASSGTVGGPPASPTFDCNPVFLLSLPEPADVVVRLFLPRRKLVGFLVAEDDVTGRNAHSGDAAEARDPSRWVAIKKRWCRVVGASVVSMTPTVQVKRELATLPAGQYLIVAYTIATSEKVAAGRFTLAVHATRTVEVERAARGMWRGARIGL